MFIHEGTLTAANSTFLRNQARGGVRGSNSLAVGGINLDNEHGSGFGSAIFNLNGKVELFNVTMADNSTTAGADLSLRRAPDPGTNSASAADGRAVFSLSYGAGSPQTSLTIQNSLIVSTSGTAGGAPSAAQDDIAVVNFSGVASLTADAPNLLETLPQAHGRVSVSLGGVRLGKVDFVDISRAASGSLSRLIEPEPSDSASLAGSGSICQAPPVNGVDQVGTLRGVNDCTLGAIELPRSTPSAPAGGCSVAEERSPLSPGGLVLLAAAGLAAVCLRRSRRHGGA